MPTLISRKTDSLQEQSQPCNFSDPSQNEFVTMQVTLEELRARCARYKALLASLQPPQENQMIRAANFTVESVLQLIQQSPGNAFIRVYYGIDESGEHRLFMSTVQEESVQAMTDDMLYVDDCCRCPPLLNCPADNLLES